MAKKTLCRHFPSKENLVPRFPRRSPTTPDHRLAVSRIHELAATPRDQSLALFDVLDGWFQRDTYESDAFTCTLLELRDRADLVHQEAVYQLDVIREILQRWLNFYWVCASWPCSAARVWFQ